MMRFMWPFAIFIVLSWFLYLGLGLNKDEIPSPLIDKPAPAFNLMQLHQPSQQFSNEEMKGKVWLLNFWASWCAACKGEHSVLLALAKKNIVPIYGVDYKDNPMDGIGWLERNGGNPYVLSVADIDGKAGIDYGVYGVPETYVIDKQGIIRYKQIGPVTHQNLREKILPIVAELQAK